MAGVVGGEGVGGDEGVAGGIGVVSGVVMESPRMRMVYFGR